MHAVTLSLWLCRDRCSKELNQWDILLEYANHKGYSNAYLVLESAWRVPNWALMKDALAQVGGETLLACFSFCCVCVSVLRIVSMDKI